MHLIQTLRNPKAKLSAPQHAVFSPDGGKLVVANWMDQTLNVYLSRGNGLFYETPHGIASCPEDLKNCKPHGVAFSPSGKFFAIAYGAAEYFDRALALFRMREESLECIHILKNGDLPGTPKGIVFSPDGTDLLVSFSDINSIAVFSIKNEAIDPIYKQIVSHPESGLSRPEDLKISPSGHFCAATNSDKNTVTFYPFDQKSNTLLQTSPVYTLQNPDALFAFPHGIVFSSDGKFLAISQFGPIRLTEDGDIFGGDLSKASNAAIHLYEMQSGFESEVVSKTVVKDP